MDAKRQVEAVIFACGEAAPREKVAAAVGVSAFAVDRMVEAINNGAAMGVEGVYA